MIIGTNFKLSSKKYLDNRQQCASLNDLIINKDSILYPQGFEVYCIKEKAWYQNVSEGDTPEWKIRQSGTSEGGASIDDTKISATTTWSSEYIYDMKLELQDLITQTEDYVTEIDDRLLYVEGRLTSIGSFDGSYDSLTNKPEFPSLQGYATHEYVDEVIANIGKIEGTKDYNELINQPINNAVIEYMIDERLIVNVGYLEVGKWYIVNTDLNEEYNSATSFSLVYYLSSDSYSIINTFENEDMHSFIYVSSINEKEIKIKYTTVDGKTYELIYNKETNEKTLNLLTSSGGNGNGGFSGDYNDLTNKPFYDTRIIDNVNLVIDKDMDLSNYETKDVLVIPGESYYYKLVKLRPAYPGDIANMKENGTLTIGEHTMSINQAIDIDGNYGEDVISIFEFLFVVERDEFNYFPGGSVENGIWILHTSYILDENGEHIEQDSNVNLYDGMIIQYDSLSSGELKKLDEKFIPDDFKNYNKLINTPCYDLRVPEIETSIVFDGNTTGKETALLNNKEGEPLCTLVKMTDKPITFEEFYSTSLINLVSSNGEEYSYDLESGYLAAYKNTLIVKYSDDLFYVDELGIYVVCKTLDLSDIAEYWGECIITPGIWFEIDSEMFVSKFVYKRFAEDNIEIEICPCYEESLETITLENGEVYKKIYPCITEEQINFIKADEVNNLHYGILNGTKNENNEIILDEETFESFEGYPLLENDGYCNIGEYLMLVYEDIEIGTYTFTKGIWVLSYEGLCHRLSLKIASNFKQLDEKFIPDTIATKKYVDDAIQENGLSGDYNDLINRPCYGDVSDTDVIIEKTITDFSYENRDVVEIGALYAGWNNDLETRVFVNICQDFNEDDMKGLLNNGVFIDNTYFGELYECSFVIDSEGYGNVQLYDKGCYFYTPYSSTIDFILVTEDNYIFGDGTPLSRGIWLNYVYYGGLDYIDEFVMPDGAYITFKYTTKSVNNDSFKQLDEKYIPDSVKDYNNLSNVPCIDSRKIELEKFDIESICNKGIGDSIAEEFAIYDKIEIADGISIFKINDEPLFTYDDFLYCYLHRIDFDDNYIIIGRSINGITQKYDLDYMSSYYINNECYDPNKFLFIQDGLLIVFEDDTSILLETGNTITLSKGSYGVMDENNNTSHGKCTSAWCEIEFCHYVGEFKELDEKFIRSHLDGIYDSMVGAYYRRNNEIFGEVFNSYEESYNRATGKYSHAEGFNTKTSSFAQHVQGKYNIEDKEEKYAHIIGNGTDYNNRSNAHTLDWSGNAWYQGNISIEGTPTNDNDLTTKKYVDDLVSNVDIDLSDYITDTELEEKGYITEIPSEYITNTELEEKGYVTDTELEEEMIFETDILTVNALGGISANTDLNGLTVKEILNKLLFPYIEPVITVTATPNGGTYEKGNNQTITNVSVSITKKSEIITKIEVLNGTQVIARQNDEAINNGGTFNYNVNVNVPSTNKQLTVKITDNSGAVTTETTNSFTFVYPYYWGVCEETDVINADLIKGLTKSVTSKGTKTVTYTTNNQKMIFAYPKSYGTIKKILDPNSFDVTSTFTMSQITIIGLDGTGQSYYVYVNNPSTVSNFNMKFSY